MGESMDDAFIVLEEKVKSVPIEPTRSAFETFTDLLQESTEIIKTARATEDVIKDAYVVSAITASIQNSTKSINVAESNFYPEIFAGAIANLVNVKTEGNWQEPSWDALAARSAFMYRYAPGFTYINAFGTGESQVPVDKANKTLEKKEKQVKKPLEPRKEPEKVKTISKTVEGVSAVENICKILIRYYKHNGKKPVCFFKFVIDPNSFSKTVENIFHLSFLARDGLVKMSLGENRLPVLTPLTPDPANNNNTTSKRENIQMLPSITIKQWKEIIEEFNITEAVIP